MSGWSTFVEAWPLFADSVLAGTIAGATLGLLGTYVVLRRMVFLSAALSQMAGFGVTLAFLVGLPPSVGALVLSLATVGALMLDDSADVARRDAILGWTFLVGAAGTLAVGTRIVAELADVQTLLFGTAVAVVPEDFTELAVVCAGVLVIHVWWQRGFAALTMDNVDAAVRGLPVRWLDLVLLGTIALTISVVTRVLGALPAFAFSVLPAVVALRFAPSIAVALLLSTMGGALAGFGGYYLAFAEDLPVGAAQTLLAAVLASVALVTRRAR